MPTALYFDENMNRRLMRELQRRGIDCVHAIPDGLAGAADEAILDRACELNRVLVTGDADFLALARALQQAGTAFTGVVFVYQEAPFGRRLEDLEIVAKAGNPPDFADRVEYLPFPLPA